MADSDKLFERFGREFPPGTVIFKEGDVGNEMYVIQSGKVNITKKARDQEKLLVTLGPGTVLPAGVLPILSGLLGGGGGLLLLRSWRGGD